MSICPRRKPADEEHGLGHGNGGAATFTKPGQKMDVTVSSVGNAKSLRGGELLLTQLKGGNGEVYAVAQGGLFVSGFGADGSDGSKVSVNTKVVRTYS